MAAAALLKTRSVLTASGILIAATALAKLTGFLRIQSIAAVFGATWRTDAFLTAFLVPECLYLFFTEGALSSALVPVFARHSDDRQSGALLSTLAWTALLLGTPLAVLLVFFRFPVAGALGPGFSTQTRCLAASLLAVVAAYIPAGLAGGVLSAYLNAKGHFLAPALGPLIFNVLIVSAALLLGSSLGVTALAWAVTAGGFAALIVQIVPLRIFGDRLLSRPDFSHPGVKEAFYLLAPVMFSVGLVQLQVLAERIMASSLAAGSIASLNFASKLLNLPAGMLALTVSTALLPSLSAAAAENDWPAFNRSSTESHRVLLCLVSPIAIWLALAAPPLVSLAFRHGAFTAGQAAVTTKVLQYFAPGLVPLAGIFLMTRLFFARLDSKTPAFVKAAAIAFNLALLSDLLPIFGIRAIPLAFTAMHFFNYIFLLALLYRKDRDTGRAFIREFVATALAAALTVPPAILSTAPVPAGLSARMAAVLFPGIVICAVFPALAHLMGAKGPASIAGALFSAFRRRFTAANN